MSIFQQLGKRTEESKNEPRDEKFRLQESEVRSKLTMRVIEVGKFQAVIECVTSGPQLGHKLIVDQTKLKFWHGDVEDIAQVTVGTEFIIEIERHWINSRMRAARIIEWHHKKETA